MSREDDLARGREDKLFTLRRRAAELDVEAAEFRLQTAQIERELLYQRSGLMKIEPPSLSGLGMPRQQPGLVPD